MLSCRAGRRQSAAEWRRSTHQSVGGCEVPSSVRSLDQRRRDGGRQSWWRSMTSVLDARGGAVRRHRAAGEIRPAWGHRAFGRQAVVRPRPSASAFWMKRQIACTLVGTVELRMTTAIASRHLPAAFACLRRPVRAGQLAPAGEPSRGLNLHRAPRRHPGVNGRHREFAAIRQAGRPLGNSDRRHRRCWQLTGQKPSGFRPVGGCRCGLCIAEP